MIAEFVRLPASDRRKLIAASASAPGLRALHAASAGDLKRVCFLLCELLSSLSADELRGTLCGADIATAQAGNRVDVVWTGPEVPGSGTRLTSQVIAELIGEAKHDVLLVSYAMQSERVVAASLSRATERGVHVQLLYERNIDNPNYRGTSMPFPGLKARRWCWPGENRPPNSSMHAKALVVDRKTALIGSANITDTAMLRNIECGTIIRDPRVAAEICTSVEKLISAGELAAI